VASYTLVERTGNGPIVHGTFEKREEAQALYDALVAQDDLYRDVLTILEGESPVSAAPGEHFPPEHGAPG
jgi:hypothetical protein